MYLFKRSILGLFFLLLSSFQYTVDSDCSMKYLPMTRFELRTLGVGSDRSTIWPTPLPIFFTENIFWDLGGAEHFHRIIQTATEVQLAVGILRTTSGGNDCPSVALDMAVVPEVLLARSEYSVDSGLDDFKAGLWDLFNSTFGNVLPTYSVWHIFIVANDKYLNINYPSGDAGGEVKISHMTWSVQSVPNFRVEWLFYNFWPKFYWITHSSDIISVLWWERFSNI